MLTRILAIWQYVAGHSLVLPIVRKNRERRLKTSASMESKRFFRVVGSSRTSFSFVTKKEVRTVEIPRICGVDVPCFTIKW